MILVSLSENLISSVHVFQGKNETFLLSALLLSVNLSKICQFKLQLITIVLKILKLHLKTQIFEIFSFL